MTAPDPTTFLPLVRYWARRYAHTPLGTDDAFGSGCVALVQSARRYDPESPASFVNYSRTRIMGAMQDAARTTRGSRTRNNMEEPVGIDIDRGAVTDRPFSAHAIVERLAGLRQPDRHVALLVAAGYRGDEIAAAWGVSQSRISQRMLTIKRHLESAA